MRTLAAVAGAAALAGGAIVVGAQSLTPFSSSATASTLPPPANLEVLHVDETSIQLGWGPTLPGPMTAGAATARSLVVKWGASLPDNHGPITYTFSKNGKVTATGLTRLFNKVGFTRAVRTFRACVWAVSTQGKSGPQMCATFNGA